MLGLHMRSSAPPLELGQQMGDASSAGTPGRGSDKDCCSLDQSGEREREKKKINHQKSHDINKEKHYLTKVLCCTKIVF